MGSSLDNKIITVSTVGGLDIGPMNAPNHVRARGLSPTQLNTLMMSIHHRHHTHHNMVLPAASGPGLSTNAIGVPRSDG